MITHFAHDCPLLVHEHPYLAHEYYPSCARLFFDNSVKSELKAENPVQQSVLPSRIFVVIMRKMSRSP